MKTTTSFKKGHKNLYLTTGKDHSQYKHGLYGTPLYKKWEAMKRRCFNKHEKSYSRYGGRGIIVCDKWLQFKGFAEDMGKKFKPGLSLERINNNGNYELNNCKWIPLSEQAKNKRSVKLYEYKGKKLCIPDWAKRFGIAENTLFARLKIYGWNIEKALETPVRGKEFISKVLGV